MARNVTMIPATINPLSRISLTAKNKRRVAGYARVSTDSDEQFTSYEAQVDYYTKYILSNPDWEFVKVYTDEGISGCNTKHREGFKQMISDALMGKIDLIITKSVSRFARNTVDSLTTIRQLKDAGCECYFEKEGIYTFDGKGELLITIMSSLAQEESRSISENITWGQRKRFADGKVSMPYKQFLGYRKGTDGQPEIVPEQAEIVRRIYSEFISGKTTCAIAKLLTAEGIPTPAGKVKWQTSTVESILTNEKYKGDALLQKTFTVDFLQKKMKPNEGEIPQYYVQASHPAIVSPEEWQAAQDEMIRRKSLGRKYSGTSIFATKLVCADCGAYYGAKTWHSTSTYKKTMWRCVHKYDGAHRCSTPSLSEFEIKDKFLEATNSIISDKFSVLEDCKIMRAVAGDCTVIDTELAALVQEIEVVTELTQRCIADNSQTAQDQTAFEAKYNGYVERYDKASARVAELQTERNAREYRVHLIDNFIASIEQMSEPIQQFDTALWIALVDRVVVHSDGTMDFRFCEGLEITV